MEVYVADEAITNTCHISSLNTFREYKSWETTGTIKSIIPEGGAGWIVVGFVVDDKLSEQVFSDCAQKWDVVFVSEIRKNRNTGRDVYMAVFQARKDQKYGFDDADGNERGTNAAGLGLEYDEEENDE